MARLYIFADEAGDFEFSREQNVSRYFILCTVSMHSCGVASELLDLRRELAFEGLPLGDYFHCSADKQVVRDRVFEVICRHDFQIQATIMEKSKAQPRVRVDRPRFYQTGWFFHFRHGIAVPGNPVPDLLVTAATIGTRKERASFLAAIKDVMRQTVPGKHTTSFCPAAADPCVQVADYCAWAIQRKWERNDPRSYDLIKDRITYEYELWRHGTKHYY